jgi:NAD-dependent deacetylase
MRDDDSAIEDLAGAVRGARTVTVLTGSGVSAPSGVATFRDADDGLWSRYRPEDVATPEAFARDPARVWQWYRARRRQLASAEPNAGHFALAELARALPDLRLITQNVDGLHQRAGHADVMAFHGDIRVNQCHTEGRIVAVDDARDEPPRCPYCGGLVRPGVVWFGEAIDAELIERAVAAASAADVLVSVGTSVEVQPAAGLADRAHEAGGRVAEINPDATALSGRADWVVRASAADALPRLRERVAAPDA